MHSDDPNLGVVLTFVPLSEFQISTSKLNQSKTPPSYYLSDQERGPGRAGFCAQSLTG